MNKPLDVGTFKQSVRNCIQSKFAEVVKNVKSGPASLSQVASQIGVTRQMLDQYAGGSIPKADVLLAAFLKWGWVIRVESPGKSPAWSEFSASDMEGGVRNRKREPVQLSLFDALTDLDQNIDILKKSVGRAEFELQKALGERA
jgi:hypothetical protein